MNTILFIAGLVFIIVGILVAAFNSKEKKEESSEKKGKNLPRFFLIAGIVLLLLSQTFVIIPTGYSGVKTMFGQIDNTTVQNGFNWKIPFVQSIEKVNNKQQDVTFEDKVWSETADRTAIYYDDVTVTYQINPEKSAWIYANVSNYKNSLITQSLIASAIKSSSKMLDDIDATNRSIVEPLILENAQKSLNEKYGENTIIVNKVVVNGADFDDSYNDAIAAKQKAQLEAEQQAVENQKKY